MRNLTCDDKDVLKEKMNKTLRTNIFNSNRFVFNIKRKRNIGYHEEGRTLTGYDTESYRKIHAGNKESRQLIDEKLL